MDPDEISNSSNFTDRVYKHEPDFYERLFLELFTVVGLISVTANVFIIFVIVKYKKLRRDVTNVIIAHLSLSQAAYLFVTPLTLRVVSMIENVSRVHLTVFCVFYEMEHVVVFITCLFVILLISDWYIKTYYGLKYTKFCRVYKFLVGAIYVCGLSLVSVTTQFCVRNGFLTIAFSLSVIIFIFLVLFLIVMNIVHLFRRRKLQGNKSNIGLFIANTFVGFWLPVFFQILLSLFGLHSPLAIILLVALALSSPIFNFIYLFCCEDNFNIFLKMVFRCQCNDYENDTLEDQSVTYNDVNGVEISKT